MLERFLFFILFRWSRVMSNIFKGTRQMDSNLKYVLLVNEARKEWQWANNLMQEAKETNLIDQAIYWQSAAERKYVYLIKEAAREGIKADLETVVYLALAERNKLIWGVSTCRRNYGKLY